MRTPTGPWGPRPSRLWDARFAWALWGAIFATLIITDGFAWSVIWRNAALQ